MRSFRLGGIGFAILLVAITGWYFIRRVPAAPYQGMGAKKMATRLRELVEKSDPQRNEFLNTKRVAMLQDKISKTQDGADKLRTKIALATEQMQAGDPAAAIATLEEVKRVFSQPGVKAGPDAWNVLHIFLGTAHFRLGEQENCITRHSVDSCLLPIKGNGVHTLPRGSRASIEEWLTLLKDNPTDVRARWLLNLAYQTLGEYPANVPQQFLIPPQVFEDNSNFPRFYDIASQTGLAKVGLAGGCVVDDLDGDGYLDVMSSSWGIGDQLRFFRNNRDGKFIDQTEAAGLIGEVGGLNLSSADYNNDGFLDVLVLRGAWMRDQGRFPSSLLKNNGDGTFEDVTEEAGLLRFHPTQVGVWADYNNDGWIDVFFGNESTEGETHPCELFRNNGNGTFTNVAAAVGLERTSFVKGANWGDYNNDGFPDLVMSRMGEPDLLFRNDGPTSDADSTTERRFTDVSAQARIFLPIMSFSTWFFDFDNDGWDDIFIADYPLAPNGSVYNVAADLMGLPNDGDRSRLYRNNGDGTFSDVTKQMGLYKVMLIMGSNFGDLDNDGWLDMYLGTGDPIFATLIPNRMFRSKDGKGFEDVTFSGGFGHLQKGHGISFADLDNDGDQDVYEVMGGAHEGDVFASSLYENPGFGNHWITLRLEGVRTNRAAIGARIKVTVETPEGERQIRSTVSTGSSFGGNSLQQEIGLGKATAIKSITIDWPTSKSKQVFENVAMDQIVKIREGENQLVPVTLATYDLSPAGPEGGSCPFHPEGMKTGTN